MRWLPPVSMVLAFLLGACTEPAPATTPAVTDPPPAPTGESMPDRPDRPDEPVRHAEGPEYFFATLGQTGVEHCPDGTFDPTWLDVQPTLGFVTMGEPDNELETLETLETLMDQPVLARGSAEPAPERPPLGLAPKPCPIMQMRSDWVNTPRGIRVQRGAPLDIAYFQATSVRRLDELSVTRDDDDHVTASFTNPLPFALRGVRLVMYYEGCYGKPGTTSTASDARTLAPGEALEHRFSLIAEYQQPGPRKGGPPARVHRASSLVLELDPRSAPEGAAVHADLAVSLSELGVDFECP